MPLTIIFAECGIELIPKQIRNHPAIRKSHSPQIYSSQLLDNALHHSAMKDLVDHQKRGRPDIIHICLLNALGSVLNKSGFLEIYVHTVKNNIYKFSPEVRIARNFNRFKGLIAKLLIDGDIKADEKNLISQYKGNLNQLVKDLESSKIYVLSSRGTLVDDFKGLFSGEIADNTTLVIGGFQKGTFSPRILGLSDNVISISSYSLDAWVAVYRVISLYEMKHSLT